MVVWARDRIVRDGDVVRRVDVEGSRSIRHAAGCTYKGHYLYAIYYDSWAIGMMDVDRRAVHFALPSLQRIRRGRLYFCSDRVAALLP